MNTPEDLFRLGQHNPTVQNFLFHWRHGYMTWEQMLLNLAVALCEQNSKLMDSYRELVTRGPQPIIIKEK